MKHINEFNFFRRNKKGNNLIQKDTNVKNGKEYLKDLPKDIAFILYNSKISDEKKQVIADVIKGADNIFISQTLSRWIKATKDKTPFKKPEIINGDLGHLDLTDDECDFLLKKIEEFQEINQKFKTDMKNKTNELLDQFK